MTLRELQDVMALMATEYPDLLDGHVSVFGSDDDVIVGNVALKLGIVLTKPEGAPDDPGSLVFGNKDSTVVGRIKVKLGIVLTRVDSVPAEKATLLL